MPPSAHAQSVPLWPLPLLCALLPFAAGHLGWGLSTAQDLIPACNPYLDGCVSISRASRHGLANAVFQALVLPSAALQALCWLAASRWLQRAGTAAPSLPWMGCIAGIALALYAAFLGSDGRAYEVLRRYGTYLYFGFTYLALLVTLRALARQDAARARRPLLAVAWGFLLLGVLSLGASYLLGNEEARNRAENLLEWHVGLWLTAIFAVLAWCWWRERLVLRID